MSSHRSVLGAVLASLGLLDPAAAATYAVNSTLDAVDANPGNNVCAAAGGACTLRAAVMEANAHGGPDLINVPAGVYRLTLAGSGEDAAQTGDLDEVGDSTTIGGAGAGVTVLDGNGLDRVVQVHASNTVMRALTLRGGTANAGGGAHNLGELTVEDCELRANAAVTSGGVGGGIDSVGTLVVERSVVAGNTALFRGGGIHGNGGSLTISDSVISENLATVGAAMSLEGAGSWNISRSTLSSNHASSGGGLHQAGGISFLRNTTISGNDAERGGGILLFSGLMGLNNVTISGNRALGDASDGGGGILRQGGAAALDNTLIADNSGASGPDCKGTFGSGAGHNLVENTADCALGGTTAGNLTGTDPQLLPLANYRGLTPTHALASSSAAHDAGDNATCESTDQRLEGRPVGTACEIGSFERGVAVPVSLLLDSSLGNSVLEADETARVVPTLRSLAATLEATSSHATRWEGPGPAGLFDYDLVDADADYGDIPAGGLQSCLGANDCLEVRIDTLAPGTRPTRHWDARLVEGDGPAGDEPEIFWSFHVGESFADVPTSHPHYRRVESLLHHHATAGCSSQAFCPQDVVPRRQLALWLAKILHGQYFVFLPCLDDPLFGDVANADAFCPFIEQLALDGVMQGCGGGDFCPNGPVSREHAAKFVVKALEGGGFVPPPCDGAPFLDVDPASAFCPWIQALAAGGPPVSCGGGNFCPSQPLTRGQLARVLGERLDLEPWSLGL